MKQSRYIEFSVDTWQFCKGQRADYCVYACGYVTRTWKKSMIEELVKPYKRRGKLIVKCNQKEFTLKHLVAAGFLPDYKKGDNVICVDGNENNCHIDNLCIVSKKHLGRITGHLARSKKIQVKSLVNGEIKEYGSIRKAAKGLNCSYQTIIDKINNKYKNTCISDYEFKEVISRV